jgi:hypothetical protein
LVSSQVSQNFTKYFAFCEILPFLSGSCLITEVIEQLYYKKQRFEEAALNSTVVMGPWE